MEAKTRIFDVATSIHESEKKALESTIAFLSRVYEDDFKLLQPINESSTGLEIRYQADKTEFVAWAEEVVFSESCIKNMAKELKSSILTTLRG